MLGLCNHLGYVVLLSAAHDLLTPADPSVDRSNPRHCNRKSTGAILLATILPAVIIKSILPFLPLRIHLRMISVVVSNAMGYVVVGLRMNFWSMIAGIGLTSFASGTGESSLMAYSSYFKYPAAVSRWSSGTGTAGVLGSSIYALLRWAALKPSTILYGVVSVPILMSLSFWLVIVHPPTPSRADDIARENSLSFRDTFNTTYKVITTYTLPFFLVFLFEYFINQGLSELVTFDDIFLQIDAQYRWYNLVYQIGSMLSRSSVSFIQIDDSWMLALLQAVNVAFMTTEAIYLWLDSFWAVLVFIFYVGLLGGFSYANTFRRIDDEVAERHREFCMCINTIGDSLGITLAAFIAIPAHNAICQLPPPK